MPARARHLVVMVKEPAAGRVKTRLARGIGVVLATQFYRHATAAVLARVASPREWITILAVAPDAACRSRAWAASLARMSQGGGDLGARMQRVMDGLPPGPVLIIGSDIPGIRACHIRAAFRALGGSDAVLGPCPDGGYWLVGLKRLLRVPRAFGKVRWSSEHALADTERNLAGLRLARAAVLDDVDEAGDLAAARGRYGRRV
jgi:hypothetical protein